MGNFLEIPFITPYFGLRSALESDVCSDHTNSQLGWFMYETDFRNTSRKMLKDNPEYGSIVTRKISDTQTEYTIRMIDGVPDGTKCDQIFFLKFRPGCPSVKKRTLQGTINGLIETTNAGYEQLFIDVAPPYLTDINDLNSENWTNPNMSFQYKTYYSSHPVLGYANHVGLPATGYRGKRLLLECSHSSGFEFEFEEFENPTIGYRIESQNWKDPTENENPDKLREGSDLIYATIKSDHPEDEGDVIELRNSDSCPGYIAITAQTLDGQWQVNSNIYYEINLTIDEYYD